jgi:hypothetical protein
MFIEIALGALPLVLIVRVAYFASCFLAFFKLDEILLSLALPFVAKLVSNKYLKPKVDQYFTIFSHSK